MYVCACACMCVCMCVHICMCMCVDRWENTRTLKLWSFSLWLTALFALSWRLPTETIYVCSFGCVSVGFETPASQMMHCFPIEIQGMPCNNYSFLCGSSWCISMLWKRKSLQISLHNIGQSIISHEWILKEEKRSQVETARIVIKAVVSCAWLGACFWMLTWDTQSRMAVSGTPFLSLTGLSVNNWRLAGHGCYNGWLLYEVF